MKYQYPEYLSKYNEVGFDEDWAHKLFKKYNENMINRLSNNFSPLSFYDIDIINIKNNQKLIHNLTYPEEYTVSEILLYIMDLLNEFKKQLPKKDAEIYKLYNRMDDKDLITNITFEEFYVFIERVNYTVITKTPSYTFISNVVENHILKKPPIKGTTWEIVYDEKSTIQIEIIGTTNILSDKLVDPNVNCKIIKIIEPDTEQDISCGDNIQLKPVQFNKGTIV